MSEVPQTHLFQRLRVEMDGFTDTERLIANLPERSTRRSFETRPPSRPNGCSAVSVRDVASGYGIATFASSRVRKLDTLQAGASGEHLTAYRATE